MTSQALSPQVYNSIQSKSKNDGSNKDLILRRRGKNKLWIFPHKNNPCHSNTELTTGTIFASDIFFQLVEHTKKQKKKGRRRTRRRK